MSDAQGREYLHRWHQRGQRFRRWWRLHMRVSRLVEFAAKHLPGEKVIDPHGARVPRYIVWSIRYADLRNAVFPHRLYVPWQPADTDGPYMIWRWRGRDLFRRPWREGMTKERWEAARERNRRGR